jgi:glycosyltransferase involved in cell wall biosynthesis
MTHPTFKYNESMFGGTETMARGFIKHILPDMKNIHKYTNVIIPGYLPDTKTIGTDGSEYIFWLHNPISQFSGGVGRILNNALVRKATKYVIAVSEHHKYTLAKELNLELDRIYMIPNAIEPITPTPGKFDNIDKVKIIHASNASRGMEVLLNAVPLMKEDFELNIFNNFYPDIPHNFNLAGVNDPRVNFYGTTPRKTLYKFFADAHIHAYPSIFVETSCLTQMEAMSAGCYTVHTDIGALPETSMGHGVMIPSDLLTPERYAQELDNAIRKVREHGYDYTKQVQDVLDNFTWDKAKQNWLAFDATI